MRKNKWLIGSLTGFFLTLLCCATPLLVILLGILGLGVWVGYLDYVLIPLLIVFLILAFVLNKKRKNTLSNKDCCS
ncbi:mercury resistance system transport protein MerF [uncultured Marinococcus sp.]|jgi:mercuric ion transport protein|uniref:mercury resistance system transport protein MerF n=1 Tax=uncultured Marinococcus sp. TaxID=487012 RepID=UPI002637CF6E|nr:mercury resistance system transport protein MerF [uncultured Marinococcus sp.]